MCMKTECGTCHKPTWRGCGMHIESALNGVKEEDRCPEWKTGKHYLPGQEPEGWGCSVQ
ncbi:hypothetical protein L917_21290 [Phytophthora nicotianae]|uniref:Uncharacterized protein n=1 Tax=Phytophthora nicotianae TaxID=4792 RepID=W2JY62_PHYNI|nr:hypothetical protein L917_21290 [Phytophthora nicotianae]ETM31067.1 hypothetical protein L914_21291 [Phytophthora nicotianae]